MSLLEKNILIDNFNFHLPANLIAKYPLEKRSDSRLLVYDASSDKLEHKKFIDIIDLLQPGDILVRNNTKVLPARIFVTNSTGAKIEILLIKNIKDQLWQIMAKPAKKLKHGQYYELENGLKLKIIRQDEELLVDFGSEENYQKAISECGTMPIPPYMKRSAEELDKERYQTIFSKEHDTGVSVAAPTAGLHFTEKIDKALREKEVEILELTLHVGIGTFAPIKTENILEHKMHSEYYEISPEIWQQIQAAKKQNRRIIAVGSTSTRVLEAVAQTGELSGETDIFIYPGFEFKVIDGMVTNFHLPKSSLLVMISAFLGENTVKQIYQEAIKEKYRFYSYGDACLFLR